MNILNIISSYHKHVGEALLCLTIALQCQKLCCRLVVLFSRHLFSIMSKTQFSLKNQYRTLCCCLTNMKFWPSCTLFPTVHLESCAGYKKRTGKVYIKIRKMPTCHNIVYPVVFCHEITYGWRQFLVWEKYTETEWIHFFQQHFALATEYISYWIYTNNTIIFVVYFLINIKSNDGDLQYQEFFWHTRKKYLHT